jgi:hypothetical protein
MMHVSFALFADAANLSQEGKLNILGVFDALQVAALPAVHPRAHLVLHIKGTGADVGAHTVNFRWINPSGSELWNSSGDLSVGAPPPGTAELDLPLIAQIDLPIDSAGSFTMSIAIDGDHTVDVPVHVRPAAHVPAGTMLS